MLNKVLTLLRNAICSVSFPGNFCSPSQFKVQGSAGSQEPCPIILPNWNSLQFHENWGVAKSLRHLISSTKECCIFHQIAFLMLLHSHGICLWTSGCWKKRFDGLLLSDQIFFNHIFKRCYAKQWEILNISQPALRTGTSWAAQCIIEYLE